MIDTKIIHMRHPHYSCKERNWRKWRLVAEGGDCFVEAFIKKFSKREDPENFDRRKCMTPTAAFAKAAVTDIKNSIFQRTADVVRRGGSDTYVKCVEGKNNGVDLHGSSMNTYFGKEILYELLTMARIGVFVDMPVAHGPTLKDQMNMRPYLYSYKAEDILTWQYRRDDCNEFQSLLLRDYCDSCDNEYGLPCDTLERYRHIWLQDGQVHVQFYNAECECTDINGVKTLGKMPYTLDIDRIPFVLLEISDSLLTDVANNQIALMNMESSDVGYSQLSTYPLYVEQDDGKGFNAFLRPEGQEGTSADANTAKDHEARVGNAQGRRYVGPNAPAFINPSSEPLQASMAKQQQLKEDIRHLVNLTLSHIQPKSASAESKSYDERGLESGLSYIGLELEHAERKIAEYWKQYESYKGEITIQYPKRYSLQSDEDRRRDVKQLEELRDSVPSPAFQKTISKQMVQILLGGKLSTNDIDIINAEIDKAECFTANPDILMPLIENGVLDKKLAAKLLGIPEASVDKAAEEHAERLHRIALHQAEGKGMAGDEHLSGARGINDTSGDPSADAKAEKTQSRQTDTDAVVTDKTRGAGK